MISCRPSDSLRSRTIRNDAWAKALSRTLDRSRRVRASWMTERIAVARGVDELQVALATDGAFEAWYRRTLPRVYSYLLSRCGNDPALAEELTQQTFIAAIDRRSRFDGRSDTVTWLCGIARHKLADHFRLVEREERRRMRLQVREIQLAGGDARAPDSRRPRRDRGRSPLPAGGPTGRPGLRRARRPPGRRGRPADGQERGGDAVAAPPCARWLPSGISRGSGR